MVDRHSTLWGAAALSAWLRVKFRRRQNEHARGTFERFSQCVCIFHPGQGDLATQVGPISRFAGIANHRAHRLLRCEERMRQRAADLACDTCNDVHERYTSGFQ